MEHRIERFDQTVLNEVQLLECDRAVIELPVVHSALGQFPNDALNSVRRWFAERAAGSLDRVSQHHDGCLNCLRLGAGVTEIGFGRAVVLCSGLGCSVKEVFDQRRAVMLLNQVDDSSGEVMQASQLNSVLDVRNDHDRAHRGIEVVVFVLSTLLVLDEVFRLAHFANVVKVGPDAAEQAIGAD